MTYYKKNSTPNTKSAGSSSKNNIEPCSLRSGDMKAIAEVIISAREANRALLITILPGPGHTQSLNYITAGLENLETVSMAFVRSTKRTLDHLWSIPKARAGIVTDVERVAAR